MIYDGRRLEFSLFHNHLVQRFRSGVPQRYRSGAQQRRVQAAEREVDGGEAPLNEKLIKSPRNCAGPFSLVACAGLSLYAVARMPWYFAPTRDWAFRTSGPC